MASVAVPAARRSNRQRRSRITLGLIVLATLLAMALDTTVVRMGSETDTREQGFSRIAYGEEQFPVIEAYVRENAVDVVALSNAIDEDKSAAVERYGVSAGVGAIIPVRFTGVVGEGKSGVFDVSVEGFPADRTVRVQTGPAVNGTDLRDATGEISFGQFTNQIEYQDAASGINEVMKREVLNGLDRDSLPGERVTVVGVFKLINPNNWLVTPVALEVR